jgi:MOSC domain-containing protein YiiM
VCNNAVLATIYDEQITMASPNSSHRKRLFSSYINDLPPGELTWIGLRPSRKAEIVEVGSAQAIVDSGLDGDHRFENTLGSGRQVTLVSEEYIGQIEHFLALGRSAGQALHSDEALHPRLLRRNLVIKGINLDALRYQQFSIGGAIFEAGAICHPCLRMEELLGKGGIAAMMGHGGLCLKVVQSGTITLGDTVCLHHPQQGLF